MWFNLPTSCSWLSRMNTSFRTTVVVSETTWFITVC